MDVSGDPPQGFERLSSPAVLITDSHEIVASAITSVSESSLGLNFKKDIPKMDLNASHVQHDDTSLSTSERTITKDAKFYFDFATFKVENTLFRIPQYYFSSNTDVFATRFSSCGDNGIIQLEDVDEHEFRALLHSIHPMSPTESKMTSKEEWISILKLSTKWMMPWVRQRAIDALNSQLSIGEKVLLGRSHRVIRWLRSSYVSLAGSESYLLREPEIVEKLGPEAVFRLYRARENAILSCWSSANRDSAKKKKGKGGQSLAYGQRDKAQFESKMDALLSRLGKGPDPDVMECVTLARQVNVREFLLPALEVLAKREAPISISEARILGFETTIRLAWVRERYLKARESTFEPGNNWVQDMMCVDLDSSESHDSAHRVALAKKVGVRQWFRTASMEIIKKKEALTAEEAVPIGLEDAIELCHLRYMYHTCNGDVKGPVDYLPAVEQEFALELEEEAGY